MTTIRARAHALIAAAEKATEAEKRIQFGFPDETRAFHRHARNDAPDIARALVEAMALLHRLSALPPPGEEVDLRAFMQRSMQAKDDARAFLAQHGGERREG